MADSTLTFDVLARDLASQTFGKVGQSADGLSGKVHGLGGAFKAALETAAVASVAAFAYKSTQKFQEVGAEVRNLSRLTGESAAQASKLRFAAEETGVAMTSMATAVKTLEKHLAANDTTIKTLGISYRDASGKLLPFNVILGEIADKFRGMPDGPTKTALALKLFGRAGTDMIPMLNKGSGGMKQLGDEAQKLGLVLDAHATQAIKKATQASRDFHAAMDAVQVAVGERTLPVVTKLKEVLAGGLRFVAEHQTTSTIVGVGTVAAAAFAKIGSAAAHMNEIVAAGETVVAAFRRKTVAENTAVAASFNEIAIAAGRASGAEVTAAAAGEAGGAGAAAGAGLGATAGLLGTIGKFAGVAGVTALAVYGLGKAFDALGISVTSMNQKSQEALNKFAASSREHLGQVFVQAAAINDFVKQHGSGFGGVNKGLADQFHNAAKAASALYHPIAQDDRATGHFGITAADASISLRTLTSRILAVAATRLDFTGAVDAFHKSLNDLSQAVKDNGKVLDGNSDKAINNRDALRQIGGQVIDLITKYQKHRHTAEEVRQKAIQLTGAFEKQAVAEYGNKQAVDRLISSWHLMPKQVGTRYQMNGVETALYRLGQLNAQLKQLPESKTVRINYLEATRGALIPGEVAAGVSPKRHAAGGPIVGGSGVRDDIPALLMGGEFVVDKYGRNLPDAVRFFSGQRFATGGPVGQEKQFASLNREITHLIDTVSKGMKATADRAQRMLDHASQAADQLQQTLDARNAYRRQVTQGLLGAGSLSNVPEFYPGSGVATITGFLRRTAGQEGSLSRDLHRAERRGLSRRLAGQIYDQGLAGLPQAAALSHASYRQIRRINRLESDVRSGAQDLGSDAAAERFGGAIHAQTATLHRDLIDLRHEMHGLRGDIAGLGRRAGTRSAAGIVN